MEKDLLLVLSEKIGCMYLSDLKFIQDKSRILGDCRWSACKRISRYPGY